MNAYRTLVAQYRKSVEALKTASALAADHYSKVPADFDDWTEEAQDEFFVTAGEADTAVDSRFGIQSAITAMHAARQAMFAQALEQIKALPQYAEHAPFILDAVGRYESLSAARQSQLLRIFLDYDGKPYIAKVATPATDSRQLAEFQMQASGRLFV